MHRGWYQVGFARDLRSSLTSVFIGGFPILLRHDGGRFSAYAGSCPHRGANLGVGGQLEGDSVVCPFHGMRIGLGLCQAGDFAAAKSLSSFESGGLLFVAPANEPIECGFQAFMDELTREYAIIPGFVMPIEVAPELVIENAFDALHFKPVHKMLNTPHMRSSSRSDGGFAATGTFEISPSPWQKEVNEEGKIVCPFEAVAFGPTIVVSTVGGTRPYRVITAATPRKQSTSHVFLSLVVLRTSRPPDAEVQYLLRQMREGLEQDRVIWENLAASAPFVPQPGEEVICEFRRYIEGFHV